MTTLTTTSTESWVVRKRQRSSCVFLCGIDFDGALEDDAKNTAALLDDDVNDDSAQAYSTNALKEWEERKIIIIERDFEHEKEKRNKMRPSPLFLLIP